MSKVKKIILITFLSFVAIAFLISSYYLATYELPAPVDKQAIVKEKAIKYLNERYGEEFEVINFIYPEPYHNFYNITALRKGDPNDIEHEITLHGWVTKGEKKLFKKEKDNITFYDNYAAIKIIPELKEKISELVLEDYPECKIHLKFDREWIDENVNEYSSAEEFLEKDTYWKQCMILKIFVFSENLERTKKLEKYSKVFFKQLANNQFRGSIRYLFINDYNTYKELEETFHVYNWWADSSKGLGECGKDYVYSDCFIKNIDDIEVKFDDKP